MHSWDWGPVWLFMVLSSVAVGVALVVIVFFLLRRDERTSFSTVAADSTPSAPAVLGQQSSDHQGQPGSVPLGEVFKSLAPTLMDDEKRVMDELARAGGEVLQSDLPRMTDFSKATVSKVIHNLEVRGIVLREKHKWTYWCKINPRLIERVQRGETVSPRSQGPDGPTLES